MKKNYSTPKIKHVILEPSDIVCDSLNRGQDLEGNEYEAQGKRFNGIWDDE